MPLKELVSPILTEMGFVMKMKFLGVQTWQHVTTT